MAQLRHRGQLGQLAPACGARGHDTDQLAAIVRTKLLEAKERWEAVASPAQLNQVIGELVGPSIVTSDGKLLAVGATKNPAHANDVHGVIAGGGFEPPTSGL